MRNTVKGLVPPPPKTATWHGKNDHDFIEKRRGGLDSFIQSIFLDEDHFCEPFMQFLGLVPGWDALVKGQTLLK